MKPVLIVDDDLQMRLALNEAIQRLGYNTVLCDSGRSAIEKLNQSDYALVVTDMKMPRMNGLELLKEIRCRVGNLPVLVITGFGTIENAVKTMKEGAADYLLKPFSFDTLKEMVESIMLRTKNEKDILTADPEMKKIIDIAGNLAASDITVLIYGESGTGKELLARYIHRLSKRADKPFVAVNCAAIPDNLLESELFGHEKGAFTGAIEKKKGKFEFANGGTILLDEIGEMSMALQAKLLRVLQEREIDRVGGKEPVQVDVRVIATTNRDLKKECIEGRFKEDLYYRLNVFPLKVPPLRERSDDITILASYFLEKFSNLAGKKIQGFSVEGMDLIKNRPWYGNIRELENTIQRAVFLCKDETIDIEDLMLEDEMSKACPGGKIKDMEKDLIMQTLNDVNGNKTKAAKILGVSVRTIRNKLKAYKAL
ncbi:MAG: sigma-54 dependent transcriptional regulator [Nitrospirota bacterium]